MKTIREITFFARFEADIVAGRKTITLRDETESHFTCGEHLRVARYEDGHEFCSIEVKRVEALAFNELNEEHARQENMSLDELKAVINDIYPGIEQLYLIEFFIINS